MRRLLLLVFVISAPCYAVPVIPNFTQGQVPAEPKLPQILQRLYEQQNIILGFFTQLQDQEYSMTDLLLLQQLPQLVKQ